MELAAVLDMAIDNKDSKEYQDMNSTMAMDYSYESVAKQVKLDIDKYAL
jgi:hypothetical protein